MKRLTLAAALALSLSGAGQAAVIDISAHIDTAAPPRPPPSRAPPRALPPLLRGALRGAPASRPGIPGAWRSAEAIVQEFAGAVDWVLWGGAGNSPGSTVVRMIDDQPVLLREGVLPFHDIIEFLQRG